MKQATVPLGINKMYAALGINTPDSVMKPAQHASIACLSQVCIECNTDCHKTFSFQSLPSSAFVRMSTETMSTRHKGG